MSLGEFLARGCWHKHPGDATQLVVMSTGLDDEGFVAHTALQCIAAAAASCRRLSGFADKDAPEHVELAVAPLFFVVLSDSNDGATVHRLGAALYAAVRMAWVVKQQYLCPLLPHAPTVHVVEEGTSPKKRSDAYLAGGIVILSGRFFCADVLHRRVSLHLSLCGAIAWLPCHARSATMPGATSVRRIGRHLASMAFAMELLTSRNAKLRGVHDAYPSIWGWDGAAPATGATMSADVRGGALAPPGVHGSPYKAPLFVVSDHVHAVVYAMRSKTVLDGRMFMPSFRIGTIEALPRFRLDVMKHFERPVGGAAAITAGSNRATTGPTATGATAPPGGPLNLSIEDIAVSPSRIDLALEGVLVAIVGETLDELVQMEARLHPSVSAERHQEGSSVKSKGRRLEDARQQQPSERRWQWVDGSAPCGVRFHNASVDDVLEGRINGLDVVLREALAAHRAVVQPYRCLVEALCDVSYLVHQLHQLSPGMFLLVLEQLVGADQSLRDAPKGVGSIAHSADARRALWTLSDKFSDVVVLSTERVFQVRPSTAPSVDCGPQQGAQAATTTVGDDDGDDGDVLLLDSPTKMPPPVEPQSDARRPPTSSPPNARRTQCLAPSPEAPGQRLDLIKSLSLGWIGSMMRKMQRCQANIKVNRSSMEATPPSLLILADNEATMRQIAHFLVMPRDEFVRMELERFIALYRRFRGVAPTATARSRPPMNPSHRAGGDGKTSVTGGEMDGVVISMSSDDEDANDDVPTEDVLAHRMTQSPPHGTMMGGSSSPSSAVAGVAQELLLTQELGDVALMDDCDILTRATSAWGGADAVASSSHATTATGGSHHPHTPRLVFVGMTEGSIVLAAEDVSGSKHGSVMVRIVNATTISAHNLVAFYREGCGPLVSAGGGDAQRSTEHEVEVGPGPTKRVQWDPSTSIIPPVGRIIVCSPTLRTLRMMESFQDLVNNAACSSTTGRCSRRGGEAIKVLLLTTMEGRAASSVLRDKELSSERHYFHDLLIHKASMVQEAFADWDEQLETARLLQSGLQRRTAGADAPPRPQPHEAEALMPMALRLRPPRLATQPVAVQRHGDGIDDRLLVIFDEREFRSSLPYQLYCRGFQVLPLTLLHGDYLIASNYAMERKSLSDLTQSLMSGRLLAQLTAMSRQFAHPTLLIEFSRATAFRMFPPRRGDAGGGDWTARREAMLRRKLAGTLVANPRAHVLWCRSPQHAAALCLRIRESFADAHTNADPADESLTQRKEGESAADSLYAMRVLRQFPGVDGSNVSALMDAAGSLSGLALLSEGVLKRAIGEEKGTLLHRFLHTKLVESV